jgi:hypothetical protein
MRYECLSGQQLHVFRVGLERLRILKGSLARRRYRPGPTRNVHWNCRVLRLMHMMSPVRKNPYCRSPPLSFCFNCMPLTLMPMRAHVYIPISMESLMQNSTKAILGMRVSSTSLYTYVLVARRPYDVCPLWTGIFEVIRDLQVDSRWPRCG